MADRRESMNDPEEAQRLVLDGRQVSIWTAIPGIIQSVDFEAMTCEVQPTIQGVIFDENSNQTFVNLPLLVDVPLVFPSAGGFILTFPIAAGDEVLVVFASRCIDAWWQSGGIQKPMEARMHDLSDGFAIPGPRSQPNVVPGISETDVQLRNQDGTTYVGITDDGKIELVSPVKIAVTGDLTVSGTIVAAGEITSGDIPLTAHLHTGVTSGGSNTGGPIP